MADLSAPVGVGIWQTGELGYFHLSQAPRQKLHLLRGEETMYPAEHSSRLDEVDQIPIFNKKGTQYFMDVEVGTPRQTPLYRGTSFIRKRPTPRTPIGP
jgi:hypothetical protein